MIMHCIHDSMALATVSYVGRILKGRLTFQQISIIQHWSAHDPIQLGMRGLKTNRFPGG